MSKAIIISDLLCKILNRQESDIEFLLEIAIDSKSGAAIGLRMQLSFVITPSKLIDIDSNDIIVNAIQNPF